MENMPDVSTIDLIDDLRRSDLLDADQLDELPRLTTDRCLDARGLAKAFVQRGWLTLFQANQLLAGNGKILSLGPYRILDQLGEGGLSQVFKARHAAYNLIVALKVIRPEILDQHEGRKQFLREMKALARLNHPNIVHICDSDQTGEMCYFAMEYVEGTDLGKFVRLGGALSSPQASIFIRQAALGLQHAHEHNLVHRDIKPVNLFLIQPTIGGKAEPLIKILDWGLASMRSAGAILSDPKGPKGIVGTVDYLAPEQALNPRGADIRSDIYSLGCIFYYLLTGQPPFPTPKLVHNLRQHQEAEPTSVESFRDDMPPALSAILKRMLAKNPADRFQTPAAVALALHPFTRPQEPTPAEFPASFPNLKNTPLPGSLAARRDWVAKPKDSPQAVAKSTASTSQS
jgi:serine/threonine-protein kinase